MRCIPHRTIPKTYSIADSARSRLVMQAFSRLVGTTYYVGNRDFTSSQIIDSELVPFHHFHCAAADSADNNCTKKRPNDMHDTTIGTKCRTFLLKRPTCKTFKKSDTSISPWKNCFSHCTICFSHTKGRKINFVLSTILFTSLKYPKSLAQFLSAWY